MLKAVLGNLKKTWPVYIVLFLVVGFGSWYLRRMPEVKNSVLPQTMVKMEPHIELQFQEVTMQGREKGTVRWRISAQQVSASQNQQYIYFEKEPKGTFYNLKNWDAKDGEPSQNKSLNWTAKRAEYDSLMEEMTITGSASFVTEDQDTIKTEEVRYKAKLHQVVMPKPIELKTKDQLVLRSQEASADTEMESVQLKGNVELISPLKDQEKPL